MNVLMLLSNSFARDPRVHIEAVSLVKAGHKVTVLAWDKEGDSPATEVRDGINIVRTYNTGFMKLLPYEIFRMHIWWRQGYKDALNLHKKQHFDVVHCKDFDSLPIGVKLKKKLGIKLIFDAHEIWGYMIERELPRFWANYYKKKEVKLALYADGFIIAEDKYEDYFKQFYKKDFTPILNCKHLITKEYIPPKGDFTLLFIGRLSEPRFVIELAEVVKELDGVKCIIGGVGKAKYVETLKQKCNQAKNIDFIGPVSPDKVIPMTQKSHVVVCMIDPNVINNKIATANKQFEAMVTGRPIICTKGTRSGEITEQEKCGPVVEYTKEALKESIIKLRDNPKLCEDLGKNALKAAINKYNWEIEEKKLIKLYEKMRQA
ncbi:MAG: glycosyltransferase [Thermoplasmatales archaeon]|nr:glycosyltransferase [Thermoplasmatales archaeon]